MTSRDGPTELEPEIKVLRAKARDALDESFIDDFDTTNDEGDKIEEQVVAGPANTEKTIEINLSKMYRPTASTTGDVGLLVLEAEMAAGDEYTIQNAHVPATVEKRDEAIERIEAAGYTPAWEQ